MKKKIISGIIICTILLSSYLIVNATSSVTNLQQRQQNNEVTVTFKVSKVDDGLDALSGKIVYDKSKLEFVKIEKGNSKWQEPSYNDNSGKFTLLVSSETVYEACDAIKITFKVKENVTGSTKVTISEIVGATSKDEAITLKDVTTNINIEDNPGDDGNNNEIDDNTNIIDGNGNSNEINNNTNTVGGNDSNNNTTNTIDDNNNQNKENTISGNIDDIADGKLPQTGEENTKYIIIGMIIVLVIIGIILIYKQKEIIRRK